MLERSHFLCAAEGSMAGPGYLFSHEEPGWIQVCRPSFTAQRFDMWMLLARWVLCKWIARPSLTEQALLNGLRICSQVLTYLTCCRCAAAASPSSFGSFLKPCGFRRSQAGSCHVVPVLLCPQLAVTSAEGSGCAACTGQGRQRCMARKAGYRGLYTNTSVLKT